MKSILFVVFAAISLSSCLYDQNVPRSDVEQGIIEHSYVDATLNQYLAIILDIEDSKKWKIFYTDDTTVYYGHLKNEKIIDRLYRYEKSLIEKDIPLWNDANIKTLMEVNIREYLKNQQMFPQPLGENFDINWVYIIKDNDIVRYQFEIIVDFRGSGCLFGARPRKLNGLIITDQNMNVLDGFYVRSFK